MAKMLGRGAQIWLGGVTAVGYVFIPQIRTIGEIRKTSARVDVTTLENLAKEYLPDLPDPSTITCTGLWDPLNPIHQQLDALQRAGTVRFFQIRVFRAAALNRTGTFQAYVAEFASGPFENSSAVEMPLVLQLSGDVTWS